MEPERGISIFFMDGSKMSLSFPKQVASDVDIPVRLERVLGKDLLFVEADGAVLGIPFANVKYFRVSPAPSKLPDYIVRDATITG
jgi:hypothetical protein